MCMHSNWVDQYLCCDYCLVKEHMCHTLSLRCRAMTHCAPFINYWKSQDWSVISIQLHQPSSEFLDEELALMESLSDHNYNRMLPNFNGMLDNASDVSLVDRRPLSRQYGEHLQCWPQVHTFCASGIDVAGGKSAFTTVGLQLRKFLVLWQLKRHYWRIVVADHVLYVKEILMFQYCGYFNLFDMGVTSPCYCALIFSATQ